MALPELSLKHACELGNDGGLWEKDEHSGNGQIPWEDGAPCVPGSERDGEGDLGRDAEGLERPSSKEAFEIIQAGNNKDLN